MNYHWFNYKITHSLSLTFSGSNLREMQDKIEEKILKKKPRRNYLLFNSSILWLWSFFNRAGMLGIQKTKPCEIRIKDHDTVVFVRLLLHKRGKILAPDLELGATHSPS